jgi:hypothetical protein
MAFELRNPAVVLPKFNVVTVDYLPGAFPCGGVVIADQIDGFHELAVTADKISSIVRHIRASPHIGLSSPSSQPHTPDSMGSLDTIVV